ncbi:DUF2637 domain-containing protein [Streptomyces sp. CT34]|uniref:DUF2637 domain-containing protein n=1 Tax=Streptomyces sp. CT34 TaxID=1553907 RepID=UPI000A88FCC1|nr:DUF2637 domain-containing protein [Streptomyces sp. CT34]
MSATQTAQLTRTHRVLIGVVIAGAVLIAAIGFTGSYAAVRALAEKKGFGAFAVVFPIGIDAGIVVLLALDLLLTWIRIPFPLLRQTAWLLTAATIAFNGAAAWPDALGVGMHAVIPLLFVVAVEAARHAVGRIADITADKHMEGVRLTRWLLAFPSTFRLWRRMKLWELRSYDQVIQLEQDRLVYQARLRARYGRTWRRRAPVESLMPLRLGRYGVPLAQTAPAGLAAAGIALPAPVGDETAGVGDAAQDGGAQDGGARHGGAQDGAADSVRDAYGPVADGPRPAVEAARIPGPGPVPEPAPEPGPVAEPDPEPAARSESEPELPAPAPQLTVPVGPGRSRPLGSAGANLPGGLPDFPDPADTPDAPDTPVAPDIPDVPDAPDIPDDASRDEKYFAAFREYVAEKNDFPDSRQFGRYLLEFYGYAGRDGGPLSERYLRGFVREFRARIRMELEAEHIP